MSHRLYVKCKSPCRSAPAQLVARADSNIKSVKDLEGKKVGVGSNQRDAFWLFLDQKPQAPLHQ